MPTVEGVVIIDDDNPADALSVNSDGSINIDLSDVKRGREDSASFDGSIADGASETLTVDTSLSDTVAIAIDDGTTDGVPAKYDMIQRTFKDDISDFQLYDEVEKETARSWVDPALGSQFQVEITNNSGSSSTYRITVESYKEIN